ncbi:hypothetical protein ACOSQ2_017414 [Xanthoceras sorbifolium]
MLFPGFRLSHCAAASSSQNSKEEEQLLRSSSQSASHQSSSRTVHLHLYTASSSHNSFFVLHRKAPHTSPPVAPIRFPKINFPLAKTKMVGKSGNYMGPSHMTGEYVPTRSQLDKDKHAMMFSGILTRW